MAKKASHKRKKTIKLTELSVRSMKGGMVVGGKKKYVYVGKTT